MHREINLKYLASIIPLAIVCLLLLFAPTVRGETRHDLSPGQVAACNDHRVALVIGNGAYRYAPELRNPANDARAITRALEAIGFEVIAGYDLDTLAMRASITRFEQALESAKVGLVYYSGHGVGVDGIN